jgi:hypothetical protein
MLAACNRVPVEQDRIYEGEEGAHEGKPHGPDVQTLATSSTYYRVELQIGDQLIHIN